MQDLQLIIVFTVIVIVMLGIDLFYVGKNSHAVGNKEATIWTGIWVGVSLLFGGYIYYSMGSVPATEFITAYTIEKALSVDNLFVFILVFNYFRVPEEYKHKVLFWGILGAIVMRAIFIFAGVGLINLTYFTVADIKINFILTLFGAFLVYAGVKAGIEAFGNDDEEEEKDFASSPGAKLVRWLFKGKVADDYDGDKFFTKKQINVPEGHQIHWTTAQLAAIKTVTFATPLLVVVGVIEFTDLLFAVDSIPAIFSVSNDPFILYTSNIFAILGLRCMYFLLNNFIKLFRFLPHGLAFILSFIGLKMVVAPVYHIESGLSLLIVAGVLILSTLASVFIKEEEA